MASRGKTPKEPTMEDLSLKLAKLELENKKLRQRLKSTAGPEPSPEEQLLTPSQKESMLSAATATLMAVAAKKIEAKVRAKTSKALTRGEVTSALQALTMRIDLSMEEAQSRGASGGANTKDARRGRATSRTRNNNE
nr:MAG: tegument protein [Peromyscus leucopus gammaherpesvirus]